jgi:ribosomal protein S18 acetylase RimI-like enzyme
MLPITPLNDAQLDAALALVLAAENVGVPASRAAIRCFREHLALSGVAWRGWLVAGGANFRSVVVALLPPGRTAVLLTPPPTLPGLDLSMQQELVRAATAALHGLDLHFVQAMLEPADAGRRALLAHAGFDPLTTLLYLERPALHPWTEPPPVRFRWTPYAPSDHADFERVLAETYDGSLDCPELSALRPMSDVLAAHRAAGPFDPALWSLARVDGQLAGCVLLARLARDGLLEIVYFGVSRAWRRRGVGSAMMQHVLQQARRLRVPRVLVVVDERNAPARELYARFAFTSTAARLVLWQRAASDGW